jgi:hypothetical protein
MKIGDHRFSFFIVLSSSHDFCEIVAKKSAIFSLLFHKNRVKKIYQSSRKIGATHSDILLFCKQYMFYFLLKKLLQIITYESMMIEVHSFP